ncbi:MAG: hypothetical protein AAFZ63_28430 [Bacteroidota bacterium]
MKNLVSLLLLFLTCYGLSAQSQAEGLRIATGYFASFGVQPGGSISLDIPIGSFSKAYVLRPQVAVFTNPGNHYSVLTMVAMNRQWNKQKKERLRYHRLGLGLGYGLQFEQVGLSVNLGSGEVDARDRVEYSYLFPHLTYGYGRWLGSCWGMYAQLSVGQQLGKDSKGSALLNTELGVFYQLN